MCVIICNNEGKLPTRETLAACEAANGDGIGLAWLTDGGVSFRKGISLKRLTKLLVQIEVKHLPYIIHFRAATSCGVEDRLCHPFPLTSDWDALGRLGGDGLPAVVAHNGTWRNWQAHFKAEEVTWLETEKWSDSAIIAWLLAAGKEISLPISGYGNRLAFLSTKAGIKLWGEGWKLEDGIHYSNTFWRWAANKAKGYSFGKRGGADPWEGYDTSFSEDDWVAYAAAAGWGVGKPVSGGKSGGRVLTKTGSQRYVAQDGTSYCQAHTCFDRCWAGEGGGYSKEQAEADKASGGACELAADAARAYRSRNYILPTEVVVGTKIMKRANGYLIDTGDRCFESNPTVLASGNADDRKETK